MQISILTLFPDMFTGPFDQSIIKRAQEKNLVTIEYTNIRDFATDKYKTVDDKPYGGGSGMLMRVDVLHRAIESAAKDSGRANACQNDSKSKKKPFNHLAIKQSKQRIILLDPKGETFTQKKAVSFARLEHLILICGHYEGVDTRVTHFVDESISIGDYVLTGGEIPAMVIVDSVTRLVAGVLEKETTQHESFSPQLSNDANNHGVTVEYPQYTRPKNYQRFTVPEVLLAGNHKEIEAWKAKHTKQKKK